MTLAKSDIVRVQRILGIALAASMAVACKGGDSTSRTAPAAAAARTCHD